MSLPKFRFPIQISPVLPVALAIIATSFTFLCWIIGEKAYAALLTATTGQLSEQAQAISNTIRTEWIAIPIAITVCLWIWVFLVVTKRQPVVVPM